MPEKIESFELRRWVPICAVGATFTLFVFTLYLHLSGHIRDSVYYHVFGDLLPYIMYAMAIFALHQFLLDIINYKNYIVVSDGNLFISGKNVLQIQSIDKISIDSNIFGSPRLVIHYCGKLLKVSEYKMRASVQDMRSAIESRRQIPQPQ